MRAWKHSKLKTSTMALSLMALLVSGAVVQADDAKAGAETGKKKHMVDMADGLNTQEFYDSKNPDGVWSSELKMPWAKTGAINAYEEKDKSAAGKAPASSDNGTIREENISRPAMVSESTGQTTGQVNGKTVDADQLVNIRVLYTLDAEKSRASFSPVSAQNELFRQMSKYCSNGFQKIAEWSEPEGSDYYLYYQFKCMEKR
jgi:hypothetical protein